MSAPSITFITINNTTHASPSQAEIGRILNLMESLMTKQTEVAAALNTVTQQVTKIGDETRTLLTKIEALTTELANAGDASPEVQAALEALQAQVAVVDALVPDAV